jgi:hypothetical protein
MRSLRVALDDTPAGAAAIKLALSLATRHGATLTGLGVLDIDDLTAPEPRQIRTAYTSSRRILYASRRLTRGASRLARHFYSTVQHVASRAMLWFWRVIRLNW